MSTLELNIERPVAGGRMLARHDGIIVLVAGAVPGERVRVAVERRTKSVMFARVVEVLDASPARRSGTADPSCGGMDYAHIAYAEQLRCKGEVILDAFQRIARIKIAGLGGLLDAINVAPSPEQGYRLRARLHVSGGRVGFFREGSHALCDAGATGQLRPETIPAVVRLIQAMGPSADPVSVIVVSENIAGRQRVLHLEGQGGAPLEMASLTDWTDPEVSGVTAMSHGRVIGLAGAAHVTDTARDMFGEGQDVVPTGTAWTRQAASFFQGNRFLVGSLARTVADSVAGQRIADLYAGVGLFAVTLAARGHQVTAVEGDRISGRDLGTNAEAFGDRLHTLRTSVEEALSRVARDRFDTIVLDPPRAGVSPAALDAVVGFRAARVVYVSCDPATLARDSARLVSSGYNIASLRAFDLFPNTAHVEALVVFERGH